MRRIRADWVWTPDGPLAGGEVVLDYDGRVTAVAARSGHEAEEVGGLLLPGLVNAHCHLELSDLRGKVPGGSGLSSWAQALVSRRRAPDAEAMRGAITEARDAGTAALVDVTNSGAPIPLMADADLRGSAQVEILGIEPDRCESARSGAARLLLAPGFPAVETCHAVVSCAADLLASVLAPPPEPGPARTFHCDEDAADTLLLRDRSGPWADFLDRLGRDWRDRIGHADSPVALLDALDVLGPHLALVHCVHTGPAELDRLAATDTAVVLCPRSNLHIGGALPDVPGMVARGLRLAIGTDSLASCPDLDVLADAAVLAAAFPDIDPGVWIAALTTGGASLLGPVRDGRVGGLCPGAEHGLLHVALPATTDPGRTLLDGTRWARRWLSCPLLP
ncbi:MAG: amidohydrolase family protein [Alphaproteobacteria bacterium]|nr:amidohydrolase family protein [Alphaproteobacteria bacterium]